MTENDLPTLETNESKVEAVSASVEKPLPRLPVAQQLSVLAAILILIFGCFYLENSVYKYYSKS